VTGELIPQDGLPFMEKPIRDALDRVDKLLHEDQSSFSAQQLANLEGLKLSLLRGLAQTKPTTGEIETGEMVDLTAVLKEIIQELNPIAEDQGIDLSFGPSLPISPFIGELLPIQQILENLINAALNRTNQGRIVCNLHRFDVEGGEADGFSPPDHISLEDGIWLAVTIADSSPGLPAEVVQALSSDEAVPALGREGPGLSMGEIRMIAESIDAVIWYDQTPAGTTIIFAFQVT
jgi:signal transduction histidine kinase